jgi:hypothetical protein
VGPSSGFKQLDEGAPAKKAVPLKRSTAPRPTLATRKDELDGKTAEELRAIADKEGIPVKGAGNDPEKIAQTIRDIRFKRTQPASGFGEAPAKKSTEQADREIAATERARKANIRKEMRAEREARGEKTAKSEPAKLTPEQEARIEANRKNEEARTATILKSLERTREPKKATPAPAKPEIPAKDLSDKGLMQRFDAEIKKEKPDEKRLKELGDELDRRDLESNEQIKRMSDDDLEKEFQKEIRKDDLDQVKVDRLGAELDRRDHERAQNEKKVDALMAKGRSYRDAYAEVHNKDPEKMDQEERAASIEAQRRPGETREATIRRLYEDDLRRQYVDAENVTRGHLLTPAGRSAGIDPKSLFQGNSIRSNKWASDELKEYWEKNPRKTYTQFKADLLKRPQDVAAAKKTQGIQKDLDLGMKIERGPRKSIKAPSDVSEEYRKTTIAQLRQQAKDANIEVPKDLKLKQEIFDHVTKELAKREQGRRAEGPKPEAPKVEIPKPEAPKAAPERLTPHMAVGKTNASRVQPGERVLVEKGPDGQWRAATRKTGATPITVTGKNATTKGGLHRSRGGYQIVGEDDNGNKIEVRPGPGIQTYWTAPEKKSAAPVNLDAATVAQLRKIAEDEGIKVPAGMRSSRDDLAAHIEWERKFKRPETLPGINARIELFTKNPAEAKENALKRELGAHLTFLEGNNNWTQAKRNRVAQALNDYMEEEGSASPWRLRKPGPEEQNFIRDIDSVMAESPLKQDTKLWRGIGNAENIFTPEQLKGSLKGTSYNDPGFVSTSPNRDVSERFAESNNLKPGVLTRLHVPKGTKGVHLADEDQDEVLLERGLKFDVTGDTGPGSKPRILDVTVSKAPADAPETPKAVRTATGKAPTVPGAPERYADIGGRLKATGSREEARKLLSDEKLTVPQLRALADSLNIAVKGNKNDILGDLVHWTVGRRLDAAAVSKPGDTGKDLRKAAGLKSGVSTKPILPNHWGTTGGEINYHEDGKIGTALRLMGREQQQMEVPGENDNLANVLGRLATRAVRGDLTQDQLISEVKKVQAKMDGHPLIQRSLAEAVRDMDSQKLPVPELPDGTPQRIRKLMTDLNEIPLARRDKMGHGPGTNELDRLADIMDLWSKGKLTPLRLIQELQRVLFNNRHESEEGKFQLDRVVLDALKDLERLVKTDRKSLYPPISKG